MSTFEPNSATSYPREQEEPAAASSTPALQRPSRVPPPSAHRQFTSPRQHVNTPNSQARELFLLREEHALLNTQYDENNAAWSTQCQSLQDKLVQQDGLMQQLQTALQARNDEVASLTNHLTASHSQVQYQEQALAEELAAQVEEKTVALEHLQVSYEALAQEHAALQQEKTEWELERNQQMTEKTSTYEQLQADRDALQDDKEQFEAEIRKAVQSAEELLNQKQVQVVELQEKNVQLLEKLDSTTAKLEKYENDIVQQSKQILQLEECLEHSRKEAEKDLIGVQKESLDRGNEWKVERQTLQEEIRRLQERLADNDQTTAKLLEEQRRRQSSQIHDLEVQVQYLTNALTEYQGRHKELRSTVDQHLKSAIGAVQVEQNASCQTEGGEEERTTEGDAARLQTAESGSSPSTPSVHFVDTLSTSSRSAGSVPLSALRHQTPSPHLAAHSMRSGSSTSPPVSEPSVPPTPAEPVSPWIPTWQGRPIHVRADPPPSLSPASTIRSLSPPAASHSTLPQFDSVSRPAASTLMAVEEGDVDDIVDCVQATREAPAVETERTAMTALSEHRSRAQAEQVCQAVLTRDAQHHAALSNYNLHQQEMRDISALVEEKVRSAMGDHTTREYLEGTIRDLRQKLERKETVASQNWQKETNDLLEEIQRECNKAFERGKMRRTSPRSVFAHPFAEDSKAIQEKEDDEILQNLLLDSEDWEVSGSANVSSTPLSPPHLNRSLEELAQAEAMARGL